MPRDDWAKYASRDRVRRALRTGEYDRLDPPKREHRATIGQVRKAVRDDNTVLVCSKCGPITPQLGEKTFKDGTRHIEAKCPTCRKFLKWMGR